MLKRVQNLLFCLCVACLMVSLAFGLLSSSPLMMTLSNLCFGAFFIFLAVSSFVFSLRQALDPVSTFPFRASVFHCAIFSGIILLFWFLHLLGHSLNDMNYPLMITGGISLTIAFASSFTSFLCLCVKYYRGHFLQSFCGFMLRAWPLLLVLVFYSLLFIPNFSNYFVGDSTLYYHSAQDKVYLWNYTLTDLSQFTLCSHLSYTLALPLYIFEYLLPYTVGARLLVLTASWLTFILLYRIFRKIFGSWADRIDCVLLVLVFACAPLFYGLSYGLNLDITLAVSFIIFLYAAVYDLSLLKLISVFLVCFSKESGVLLVFGYYLGEALLQFLRSAPDSRSSGWKNFFKSFFSPTQIGIFCGAFVFLLVVLLSSSGWSKILKIFLFGGDSEVHLASYTNLMAWWRYPLMKLKQAFCLHFSWIMPLLVVICGVGSWIKKKISGSSALTFKTILRSSCFAPLLFSAVSFLTGSCLFITYTLYRYLLPWLVFMVLAIGAALFLCVPKKWIRRGLMLVIVGLFLIESNKTIDPVSWALFPHFDGGNGEVLSLRSFVYDEEKGGYYEGTEEELAAGNVLGGMEHNREYVALQKVVTALFEDMDYDSSMLIIVNKFAPSLNRTRRVLLGGRVNDVCYYNPSSSTFVFNYWGDGEEIDIHSAALKFNLEDYSTVYYLYFPFNPYSEDDFLERYDVELVAVETYDSWSGTLYRVLGEKGE